MLATDAAVGAAGGRIGSPPSDEAECSSEESAQQTAARPGQGKGSGQGVEARTVHGSVSRFLAGRNSHDTITAATASVNAVGETSEGNGEANPPSGANGRRPPTARRCAGVRGLSSSGRVRRAPRPSRNGPLRLGRTRHQAGVARVAEVEQNDATRSGSVQRCAVVVRGTVRALPNAVATECRPGGRDVAFAQVVAVAADIRELATVVVADRAGALPGVGADTRRPIGTA